MENMILNKGFKDAYAFRPGAILPERGVKSKTKLYNLFYSITKPIFPLLKRISFPTFTLIGVPIEPSFAPDTGQISWIVIRNWSRLSCS